MNALPLPLPPGALRTSARLLALLLFGPLAAGLLIGLSPALDADARRLVPLALTPGHPTLSQAAAILAANLRVVALPLLGAVALNASRAKPGRAIDVRALLDAFLGFGAVANALLLALSLGGYGLGRLVPWLLHLPVEFAALALALATYLAARRQPLSAAHLAAGAGLSGALLALAAVLETYGTPHA
jgi:hypothetical protein